VSGLEYVTNFGLNCYLNPGSAQATASAASPAPNASPAPAAVATPPVIDSEREYREGVSLYKAKDYDGASAKARRILEANPSNWRAWGILGNCDYARGDMAAALISYEKSLRINPDTPQLEAWVTDLRQKLGVGSHEGGSR
jgi:tetratricopeptide (TPR) repeat protein